MADTATVTFDVYSTNEREALLLAARPAGQPHSEATFVTVNRGTTRLFYGTRLVNTKAHGNTVCQTPVVPSTPPDSLPTKLINDSLPWRTDSESGSRFRPELVWVLFTLSASETEKATAIGAIGARVVGGRPSVAGGPSEGWYLVRIAGASTLDALLNAMDALYARPGVEEAAYIEPPQNQNLFQRPQDGAGFKTWFVQRDSIGRSSGALQAISAPLAWSCSVGSSATQIGMLDSGPMPSATRDSVFGSNIESAWTSGAPNQPDLARWVHLSVQEL